MAEHHHEPHPHKLEKWLKWTLIILGAILLALLVFFVAQYESLRRAQLIDTRHFELSQLLAHHAPLPVSEAPVVVRSWMTFQYLNKIFALPPDYLETQLQISNSSYPRLTISNYAKSANLDATTLVGQINAAIENYTGPAVTSTSVMATTSTYSI